MVARFLKFVSNNPLAATIVGTIIGGWLLSQLLAMKAPDVGGVVGTIGRWLRTPTRATRADIITLVAVSILLGFVGFAAILLGQYQKLRRRTDDPPPVPAHVPAAVVPEQRVVEGSPYESMERYFATERALAGRFAELEELHRKAIGCQVRWQGLVQSVSGFGFGDRSVSLLVRCEDSHDLMIAWFPEAFRERLLALPAGDRVRVSGTLRESAGTGIRIDGDSFEVLLGPRTTASDAATREHDGCI